MLCPVCRTGVSWQKRLMVKAVEQGTLVFCDINDEPDALARFGVTRETIRERLHATTGDGRLLVGVEVVAEVMRLTPGLGWFGTVLRLPVLRTFARWGYNGFARGLYRWNRRVGRW